MQLRGWLQRSGTTGTVTRCFLQYLPVPRKVWMSHSDGFHTALPSSYSTKPVRGGGEGRDQSLDACLDPTSRAQGDMLHASGTGDALKSKILAFPNLVLSVDWCCGIFGFTSRTGCPLRSVSADSWAHHHKEYLNNAVMGIGHVTIPSNEVLMFQWALQAPAWWCNWSINKFGLQTNSKKQIPIRVSQVLNYTLKLWADQHPAHFTKWPSPTSKHQERLVISLRQPACYTMQKHLSTMCQLFAY